MTVDNLAAITFDNSAGKEAHQAALIKLADGKTVDDAKAFFASEAAPTGPPPFNVAGGTTAVDPGGKIAITQSLPAGTYVFLCFVPDADGCPALRQGHGGADRRHRKLHGVAAAARRRELDGQGVQATNCRR